MNSCFPEFFLVVTLSVHYVSPELSRIQSSNRHQLPWVIHTLLYYWIFGHVCSSKLWCKPTRVQNASVYSWAHTEFTMWCVVCFSWNQGHRSTSLSRLLDMQRSGLIKSLVRETDMVTECSRVVWFMDSFLIIHTNLLLSGFICIPSCLLCLHVLGFLCV